MGDAKRLLLLRHAKSSWDDPGLDDHDRPLAPRGRRAAKRIGAHLRSHRTEITLVLCSSAQQARQTLDRLGLAPGEVLIDDELYGASAQELLERIRRVADGVEAVMVIGHDPAIHDLAVRLVAGADQDAVAVFPTAALATLGYAGPWSSLGPARCELVEFVRPRDLA